MKEYKFPYWGPLLLKFEVEDEFVKLLLERGNESREKNLDNRTKLAGQIENEYYYENYEDWFFSGITDYVDAFCMVAKERQDDTFETPPKGWILKSLWINYQQANEYNPPHNHRGHISFIIYLQVPEEIKKENEQRKADHNNPGPGTINFNFGVQLPFSLRLFHHLPEVGDLFIFPSWLDHHVHAFKSNVERISVSGNIEFQY